MKSADSLGSPIQNNLLLKENLINIIVWLIVLLIEITRCAMGIWGKASDLTFSRRKSSVWAVQAYRSYTENRETG